MTFLAPRHSTKAALSRLASRKSVNYGEKGFITSVPAGTRAREWTLKALETCSLLFHTPHNFTFLLRNFISFYRHFHHYSNSPQMPFYAKSGNTKGEYHCTIDLLFDWFGISCMTTDNFCFYLQNRLIQTSQTGGQWYSDISPFSILWPSALNPIL
jgi:hypothetical protein